MTLRLWSRQIEIIDSMGLVERKVRLSIGGNPSATTVSVSSSPSRRLAAADGSVRCQLTRQRFQLRLCAD